MKEESARKRETGSRLRAEATTGFAQVFNGSWRRKFSFSPFAPIIEWRTNGIRPPGRKSFVSLGVVHFSVPPSLRGNSVLNQSVSVCMAIGLVLAQAITAGAADKYVVKNNPGAAFPYESWATAAGDIQTAVDAALEGEPVWVRSSTKWPFLAQRAYRSPGETVWVRAGVYDSGGTSNVMIGGYSARWRLPSRVAISKAIIVRSENNDAANTIIKGAWSSDGQTNGPDAVRCAYVADGASLIGFTLTGGATLTTNEEYASSPDRSGGGVYARSSLASISNCIITGNSAFGDPRNSARGGGGACGGKYFNCVITNNSAALRGGGTDHAILFSCVVAGNSSGWGGGAGVHGGGLYGCLVSNNATAGSGGGVMGWSPADPCEVYDSVIAANRAGIDAGGAGPHAKLFRCKVVSNVASNNGGGAYGCEVTESLVAGNKANNGGGIYGGKVSSCVVAGNVAAMAGGAVRGTAVNSLFYGNEGGYPGAIYLAPGNNLSGCTVTGNKSAGACGGIMLEGAGTARVDNCVVYFNQARAESKTPNWLAQGSNACLVFSGSCTWPAREGWGAGNITNDPKFAANGSGYGTNHVPGNYKLQPDSPCPQAGCRLDSKIPDFAVQSGN